MGAVISRREEERENTTLCERDSHTRIEKMAAAPTARLWRSFILWDTVGSWRYPQQHHIRRNSSYFKENNKQTVNSPCRMEKFM